MPASNSQAMSERLYIRAMDYFPDGTSRVTVARNPIPTYMAKGEGAYLSDVDGRRFLDLNGNFTTLIHGHGFEPVRAAVMEQLKLGTCFANPTEAEINLANLLCDRVPAIERIRFVNTGTEAVLFAVKAARAFTGRSAIAKIEGAYHGAYDWVEVSQASHPGNWGEASRPNSTPYYHGVPAHVLADVVTLNFNDVEGSVRLLEQRASDLAAILIDPMPSRAGLVPPEKPFIDAIQEVARRHGILIISDEILNLRQGFQGASARYGITPDLMTLGKIIGGGFPIGAIGGRIDVMSVFSADKGRPLLPQGGTFSANPVAMVAGHACISALTIEMFDHLERLGEEIRSGIKQIIQRNNVGLSVTGAASLFKIHPKRAEPRNFRDSYQYPHELNVMKAMTDHFAQHGIILPLGAAACLSSPMGSEESQAIISAFASFVDGSSNLIRTLDQ